MNWLFTKIGGKRWIAFIAVTLIYCYLVPKDSVNFACYVGFVSIWAKLEKDKRGGE